MAVVNIDYFLTVKTKDLVPYQTQLKIAESIVNDAKGAPFSISRVGPYDYFEETYSQNYRYLLWWKGNEPISNADIIYTIYDDPTKFSGHSDKIISVDNILIKKEEWKQK